MTQRRLADRLLLVAAAALMFFALFGCSPAVRPTPTPRPSSTIPPTLPPTFTPILVYADTPAPTPAAPTLAATVAIPTQPAARPTSTRTPIAASGTMKIKVFMIAIEDGGKSGKKIGCNDSVVPVERVIPATTAPLTASIRELISLHDQYYGQSGLYNALYQSNLKIGSVSLTAGKASINLQGTVTLGGTCDSPRVAAQIQETALQFSTVKQATVTVNGVPLDRVLSGR
jgi:hypothetical protein